MFSPRFTILLVFCLPFLFSGSLAHSGRPSWAAVMWDVDPPNMEKPGIGKASWNYYLPYYLPYRLDQLWSSFEHLDPLGSVKVLYEKSTELGLLLALIYLWRTLRRGCREDKSQILSAAPETHCQNRSCKYCKLLCQLKANPALMEVYLKHMRHRYLQEDLPRSREAAKS